jgi:anti-anti-sigma regulatory factor
MAERPRHGLHIVKEDGTEGAPRLPDARQRTSLGLSQKSVTLGIGGTLNADTAGRLRSFLAMFTVDGGPGEVVLDLTYVHAVDEDGMAPIHEADALMRLRLGSLRIASTSAAVAHYLDDVRWNGTLTTGPPDGSAHPGRD